METNPFMRTSISDLVHVRNEAYKGLALEVDLIEERLVEVENIVTSLGSGKLSKSVIAPQKLRETLVSIEKQLPKNYSLLFDSREAMWQYYSALGASAIFDENLEVSEWADEGRTGLIVISFPSRTWSSRCPSRWSTAPPSSTSTASTTSR